MTTIEDQTQRAAIAAAVEAHSRCIMRCEHARMGEALDAAQAIYDQAHRNEVDRLLDETGFGGMTVDRDVRMRVHHAHDIAAAMVSAFDALMDTREATNYIEWDSTVTDPAQEAAIKAGLPPEEWPPRRQYRVIIVKPGGKSPHTLRIEAENETMRIRSQIESLLDSIDPDADLNHTHAPFEGEPDCVACIAETIRAIMEVKS